MGQGKEGNACVVDDDAMINVAQIYEAMRGENERV